MNRNLAFIGAMGVAIMTVHAQISPEIALPDLDSPLSPVLPSPQNNAGTVHSKEVEAMLSEMPPKAEGRWIKAPLPSGRKFIVGNVGIPTFLSPQGEYFLLIPAKVHRSRADKVRDAVIIAKINERADGAELLIPCNGTFKSLIGRTWRVADIIETALSKDGGLFEGLVLELKPNR